MTSSFYTSRVVSLRRVEKKKKYVDITSAKWQRFFEINIRDKWICISSFLFDWFSLEFAFLYSISNSILSTIFIVYTVFQTTSIYSC